MKGKFCEISIYTELQGTVCDKRKEKKKKDDICFHTEISAPYGWILNE
jgi:hypothetical protein